MTQERRSTDMTTDSAAGRRRYNRRTNDTEPTPPYYETFDRIASALEGIQRALENSPDSVRTSEQQMPSPRHE